MIKASPADRGLIIDLLTRAFKNNPSVNYIIRQDSRRLDRIRALMAYSFDTCQFFGEIWLSADKKACALILIPQQKKITWNSVWLDLVLIAKAIGLSGIRKILKRETQIKKLQADEKKVYLWFIAVDPEFEGKGIGSGLLKDLIAAADDRRLPMYLETSVFKNLAWYEQFGFRIYNRLELNYTLFFLKRSTTK